MELLCCNCSVDSGFDTIQFIANIGIIIIGVVSIVFAYRQFKKSLEAEKRREKRVEISKKLDDFYGPFVQLRLKSDLLYEKFQNEFRAKDQDFSTLRYLMKGKTFEGNDKKLLEEIIRIGEITEDLIHSKAGLIDDPKLRNDLIPKLTTHFLVLRLAFNGALTKESHRFDKMSFPKEIDEVVKNRIKELEEELKKLNTTD